MAGGTFDTAAAREDVVEEAAIVLHRLYCPVDGCEVIPAGNRYAAQRLADAGLLADPDEVEEHDLTSAERDQWRIAYFDVADEHATLEAERDALAEKVRRVEALADRWERARDVAPDGLILIAAAYFCAARRIRAALADTTGEAGDRG